MKLVSTRFSPLSLVICASVALAILAGTAHAQRMAVSPDKASGAAALKAQSIIKAPGSYVLSRNIVVTKNGQDAVMITSPDVTLDLQGFSIIGNTNLNAVTGNAINATGQSNVVIKNGTITGFGGAAILGGDGTSVSGVTVSDNGSGISCGIGCSVQNNVIQSNGGVGLMLSDTTSGYLGNVLQGNDHMTSGGPAGQVTGGTSLGHNLCNGVVC